MEIYWTVNTRADSFKNKVCNRLIGRLLLRSLPVCRRDVKTWSTESLRLGVL